MPDTGLPIGPALANASLELGLEGFLEAPSRPLPKSFGRTRRSFFYFPRGGVRPELRARFLQPLALARSLVPRSAEFGTSQRRAGQIRPGKYAVQQKSVTIEFYSNRSQCTRRFACRDMNLRFVITVSYSPRSGVKMRPGEIKYARGKTRFAKRFAGVLQYERRS